MQRHLLNLLGRASPGPWHPSLAAWCYSSRRNNRSLLTLWPTWTAGSQHSFNPYRTYTGGRRDLREIRDISGCIGWERQQLSSNKPSSVQNVALCCARVGGIIARGHIQTCGGHFNFGVLCSSNTIDTCDAVPFIVSCSGQDRRFRARTSSSRSRDSINGSNGDSAEIRTTFVPSWSVIVRL